MITKILLPGKAHLQFHGPANALAREVNRMFNFGIITNIPEEFKPGEHETVTCATYPKRMKLGAEALANVEISRSVLNHTVRRGKKEWRDKVAERAEAILASFRPDESGTEEDGE